jgi:hypothetical protein
MSTGGGLLLAEDPGGAVELLVAEAAEQSHDSGSIRSQRVERLRLIDRGLVAGPRAT